MASFTVPGVYISEYLNPISDVPASPGDSVAAFVGVSTGGGPIGPILISSWAQYQDLFGSVGVTQDALAFAVYSYFLNGGSPCYVVRAVNADAAKASLTVQDTEGSPSNTLTITAQAPGAWASSSTSSSRVFVTVAPSNPVGTFDLTIQVGSDTALVAQENFYALTMDPTSGRNALSIVNSPVVGSKYVTLTADWTAPYGTTKNPAATTKTPLTGGTDGTGSPNVGAAVQANLEALDVDLVINLPAASPTDVGTAVTWAESVGRHFVVADVPEPAAGETASQSVTAITTYQASLASTSSYVAIYGPWLYMQDPSSGVGAMRLVAPGGCVIGQYMRTDATRGMQKAPAGTGTALSGVIGPYADYTVTQQDSLYAVQVNVIKTVPPDTVIWGARTQSIGFPDRYIPVRRMLIAIKANLVALTNFAVFENNDDTLWATVTDAVSNYLASLVTQGALKGSTNDQAFYVTCDSSNNTPLTIAAGELHVDVGVALQNPAEFIVIRLGQKSDGTTLSDSLEA